MIESVTGTIKYKEKQQIVLDLGLVRVAFQVPDEHFFKENSSAVLYTYMHWNSENGPQLFGFSTPLERTVFLLITSCSGIGPRIGLALLGTLGVHAFIKAVHEGNDKALAGVTGIGAKKAEQLLVHLKHKIAKLVESGADVGDISHAIQWHEVLQALESLNYSKNEISSVMSKLKQSDMVPSDITFDQLLRRALSFLTK